MKTLNLGCGKMKINGVNLDIRKDPKPDVVADANSCLPFRDSTFDEIIAYHIIEHLKEPEHIMSEIRRVAKSGALIKIKVPHCTGKGAYLLQHMHYFTSESFGQFGRKFRIKKITMHKCLNPNSKWKDIGRIIDYFANLNIWFCEVFWIYWIGGMGEICFDMEVKNVKGNPCME